MKSKLFLILIMAGVLITPGASLAYASPDYDLLIIAPYEFVDELTPLKEWKDATGRPSVIVSLESIYSSYSGYDTAEQVKKCIADYEDTHNIKYVLLVGDVDKLPMRYFYLQRINATHVNWLQYYLTDHYYADLYDSGGAFCNWDANGNHIYGQIIDDDDDGDYTNDDGIDFGFDVVVGRIPAGVEDEVTRYVNKVINYEKEVFYNSWFKNIILATGAGDSVYPELPTTYDIDQNNLIATEMATGGFTAIKLYHNNTPGDPDYPNPTNINNELNDGAGFINVISHGNEYSWGVYDVRTDIAGLTNQDKLTVVYSFGCATAKLGPIAAMDPYVDVYGTLRNYGLQYDPSYYPCSIGSWVEPAVPNPLQSSTTDIHCMPEYWNFNSTGAVAFIGSTAEASGAMGSPVMQYFYDCFTDGNTVLGDLWGAVGDEVLTHHNVDSNWDLGRRWLYMNVFGDPTLVLGGLPDKPPETTLTIGSPSYTVGSDTYVSGSTPLTLTATDDGSVASTHYRYYPTGLPAPSFTSGLGPFSITGSDGTFNIEYYSVDGVGNQEYPINVEQAVLDKTAPTTTLTIGTPKYTSGVDTWIKSNTILSLSAVDTGSGVDYTQYRINGASWNTYGGPFQLTGYPDGTHLIEYRSVDNLGNTETIKQQEVIVDDTPPTITVTVGTPQYGTTPLWVTSDTNITITLTDMGSGSDYSQYKYGSELTWNTYTESFTIPGTENDNARNVTIDFRGFDNLGNMITYSKLFTLDNKPPASMLSFGESYYIDSGTVYVNSSTEFTFDPMDWEDYGGGVGVDYTMYRIDEGSWTEYTGVPFTFTGDDGLHSLEYYSVDHLGNTEDTEPYTIYLDNTPPEVDIVEPGDGEYVYGEIIIEMNATDSGSGIDYVEFSLNDGTTWLPASYDSLLSKWIGAWDTTLSSEGTHIILARAQDNVGNMGYDETPPTYNVVYLSYETEFSDSKGNSITEFSVIFNEQKTGEYKVSTNPGTIMEIITVTNTGTIVTLPNLILDVMVPVEGSFLGAGGEAFECQGAKAVKIYLNGAGVTPPGKWLPDLEYVDTMQPLNPGDTIQVIVHYEYSFKGEKYSDPDVSAWLGENYLFETDILSAYGPSWSNYLAANPLIE